MFPIQQVEETLDVAHQALVLVPEHFVKRQRIRGEAYPFAHAEHDVLVSLLDEAPDSEHAKILDLMLAMR